METFPDHVVRSRLTAPDEEFMPSAEPLVFDRVQDAWTAAAHRVLNAPDEPDEASRVTTARSLLECDDYGVTYGWIVSRWAMTARHTKTSAHRLSKGWNEGITLTHLEGMDDTWSKVSTLLVKDLLTYDTFYGFDAAVVSTTQVWIGIVAGIDDAGQLTFVDGEVVDLDGCVQISVRFS